MERFLVPYIKVILGAAFSVQQTLEGLELWTAWEPTPAPGAAASTMWDLSAAMGLPLLLTTVYLVALLVLITWAAHCLRAWRGVAVALLAIAAPGLLSLAGASTGNGWVPAYYEIGSGSLGSPWGMAAL